MTQKPTARTPAGLGRTLLLAGAIFGAFATGGVLAASGPAQAVAAGMHGGAGAGLHGAGGGMQMAAARHLDAMLASADASDEQKARIHGIMRAAFASLAPLHGRMHGTHAGLHAILTAPRVDRAALERLRVARMADVDQASRVLTKALADAAEVLTPEQRAKLGAAGAAHAPGGGPND